MIIAFREFVKILFAGKLFKVGLVVENLNLLALKAAAFDPINKARVPTIGAFGLHIQIVFRVAIGNQKGLFAGGNLVQFRTHKRGSSRRSILLFSQSLMKISHRNLGDALRELFIGGNFFVYFISTLQAQLVSAALLLHITAHDVVILLSGQ